MENPYESPSTSQTNSAPALKFDSVSLAAIAGLRNAIRWVTIIVAPILVLVFVGMQIFFIYRGVTVGIWPEYTAPQFWYSMIVLALLLLASYLVVCFWAGLFSALLFSIRHVHASRKLTANAG